MGSYNISEEHKNWQLFLYDELLKTGIRGSNNQTIRFSGLQFHPGQYVHAIGCLKGDNDLVAVVFGQKHNSMSSTEADRAIQEVRQNENNIKTVFLIAQYFSSEIRVNNDSWDDMQIHYVVIDGSLAILDLKGSKKSDDSFWLVGQPDVALTKNDRTTEYTVIVQGFDYIQKNNQLKSGGIKEIAAWFLDCDYDGQSLRPWQIFFPATNDWEELGKKLKNLIDPDLLEHYHGTKSLPFKSGNYKRCAVKIIDIKGIESLKVINLSF